MEEIYLTFQKFNDQTAAAELAQFLKENKIDFLIEDSSLNFDATFSYNELNKEFRVKIKGEDFNKANELLHQDSLKAIENIDGGYYLYDFSNTELENLLSKPDEWNAFDVALAQKILNDRGFKIDASKIEEIKLLRITALSEPDKASKALILAGYLFAIFSGIIGVFIGLHLAYHKKTLPNGTRVFGYELEDRNHGQRIFLLGIISFILYLIYRYYREINHI